MKILRITPDILPTPKITDENQKKINDLFGPESQTNQNHRLRKENKTLNDEKEKLYEEKKNVHIENE